MAEIASLEDLIKDIQKKNNTEGNIKKAFETYDTIVDDEAMQNEFYLQVFQPAHNNMYNALRESLTGEFNGDLAKKMEGKDLEAVKKAVVEALKKFFEKAHKDVLDGLDGDADVDDQYKYLASTYDRLTLRPQGQGMLGVAEGLTDNSKTLGDLIIGFGQLSQQFASQYKGLIEAKARNIILGPYETHQIAAHTYGEIHSDDGPFKITDKLKWMTYDKPTLVEARRAVRKGQLPENKNWSSYKIEYSGQ